MNFIVLHSHLIVFILGRLLLIGDIPWVAQSVESFVSKIFSCAYSSASITVLSGNPADHLIHRMAHRIVRGCLFACGRPDGRLAALSGLEGVVCQTINDIGSISSLGSCPEIISIGHNPHKLDLTKVDIFLKDNRKRYLCEYLHHKLDGLQSKGEDSEALVQAFAELRKESMLKDAPSMAPGYVGSSSLMSDVRERVNHSQISHLNPTTQLQQMVDYNLSSLREKFFGENLKRNLRDLPSIRIVEDQTLSMRLYETRFASLQRAVAFFLLFYQMGKDVQVDTFLLVAILCID